MKELKEYKSSEAIKCPLQQAESRFYNLGLVVVVLMSEWNNLLSVLKRRCQKCNNILYQKGPSDMDQFIVRTKGVRNGANYCMNKRCQKWGNLLYEKRMSEIGQFIEATPMINAKLKGPMLVATPMVVDAKLRKTEENLWQLTAVDIFCVGLYEDLKQKRLPTCGTTVTLFNRDIKPEDSTHMSESQVETEGKRSANSSPEYVRPHHRGTFNEVFRPPATPVATHGFYQTLEAENPCRNEELSSSYERTNKQIAASKIPTWAWKILVKVLGIRLSSSDSRPYLSLILHAITVLLACTFTVTGVIHTVFDIRSKFSNTTLLTGCVNLLIGFCWICLGIYSRQLAARLFSNRNFSESVRIHSRTFLKISAAGLLILFSVALASLDLYTTYIAFGPKHCVKIFLNESVCHVMYYSHVGFTFIGLLWNILVRLYKKVYSGFR
ncbi:hypothetical protein KUTeg_000097 [Tegillarca granosa]|uniref:Uncharacterized protein n=1 Tax=Tegillarca granosa TaxID=220873 RepID=A0ABQ9FZN7_TEGGR|nr:hypothetical protein KUTeg_000097 [Tegillarca granosa]